LEFLGESLLEASHMNIEAKDLGSKGVLDRELFSAADALLPGIYGHGAIMRLERVPGKWVVPKGFVELDASFDFELKAGL